MSVISIQLEDHKLFQSINAFYDRYNKEHDYLMTPSKTIAFVEENDQELDHAKESNLI